MSVVEEEASRLVEQVVAGSGRKGIEHSRLPSWLRCAIAAASRTGQVTSFLGDAGCCRQGRLAGLPKDEARNRKNNDSDQWDGSACRQEPKSTFIGGAETDASGGWC
jgi:hypothetical protein